jgi:hypothetical protein
MLLNFIVTPNSNAVTGKSYKDLTRASVGGSKAPQAKHGSRSTAKKSSYLKGSWRILSVN